MATVTVTFTVDNKHITTKRSPKLGTKSVAEFRIRVLNELVKAQTNSECGLVLDNYDINCDKN